MSALNSMFGGNTTKAQKTKQKQKEKQDELGVCQIRNQRSQTLGSGFVVRDFQISSRSPSCSYCLISSDKVFPEDDIASYYLYFRNLDSKKLEEFKLGDVAASVVAKSTIITRNSGLVVIPIEPSKKCDKNQSIFKYRPFEVASVGNNSGKVFQCHFVDDGPGQDSFSVKELELKQSPAVATQYQLHEPPDCPHTTYHNVTHRGDRKPYGAVILKRSNNEFMAAGALSFTDDECRNISPVFFPLPEKDTYFAGRTHSPMEHPYRSFNSSANKAEVKQDLKGEVCVVDLPSEIVENGSKETPAPVEPEPRAQTNNNNGEPSVQDPVQQLRDLCNDQRVQPNNNEEESSVDVPAENLRDQVDDQSVQRRNNNTDGPPAEAPRGGTDGNMADTEEIPPQDRSEDGSRQGQGTERRRSSFPTDLPKKPLVECSTSILNPLIPAGRQRKFGLGDPLAKTLLGSLDVLEAASRSLDKEYRYGRCKCWKHLAEFFGISEEEYESFKCNQVHSPTEVMFEYLESVMPDITVGGLKDGLAQIERQDVTDILIKHQTWNPSALNDETLVCSLFDSDPDIIGEMAVYLDKQKTGLKNWSHLAAKLGVPRKTFKTFETSSTGNPTEEFFEIVAVKFPKLTIGELISHLEAIERRDVINAIRNAKISERSVIRDLIAEPDVMDTVCELFNTRKRTTKVSGLKHLGRRLGIEKEILDDLLPKQEVVESPTEALIRHLGGKNPSLTLENFIWALHFIDRPDVHAVLDPYLPGTALAFESLYGG